MIFGKWPILCSYHDCKLSFLSISSILIILSRTHLKLPIFPYLLLWLHNPFLYPHPILRLPCLVFVSPVSGLEKYRNWTRLDRKKIGLQSWSLIFKNQRPQKDWSFWTGSDQFKLVSCTP